jgi:hypothetical protein
MWLIKSIGLGLLAVLAALVVCVISAVIAVFILSAREGSGGIGWDPVSLIRQQPWVAVAMVVLLCLLFALGVGAGYRRYFAR